MNGIDADLQPARAQWSAADLVRGARRPCWRDRRGTGVADNAGDGGEVDDRAAAGLFHRPHRLAAAEKRALGVDGIDPPKVGERRRLDVAHRPDSRAVDEDVEATELRENRVHDFLPARPSGRRARASDRLLPRASRGRPHCGRPRRLSPPRHGTSRRRAAVPDAAPVISATSPRDACRSLMPVVQRGAMRSAPSRRMVSPLR